MGKAAKQARNREIKRKQRENRIKEQVDYAKAMLDIIDRYPTAQFKLNTGEILPNDLVKAACEKFIKENEI